MFTEPIIASNPEPIDDTEDAAFDNGGLASSNESWLTSSPYGIDQSLSPLPYAGNQGFFNASPEFSETRRNSPFQASAFSPSQQPSAMVEIQSLLARIAALLPGFSHGSVGQNNALAADAEPQYRHFEASSVGDPHDYFDGKTVNGQTLSARWDSMKGHNNLLHSNSIDGGYQISSHVTTSQANGITMNHDIDLHLDGGMTNVHYDADGSASLQKKGVWQSLTPGTNLALNSETCLNMGLNNALNIYATNDLGGSITTKLTQNGQGGVDVQTHGDNVALGGYLAESQRNTA